MIEGGQVVAGEAILSGATTTEHDQDELLEVLVEQHAASSTA